MVILFLVIGAQFFCGMSSVTANSRMIYAFARDGAIPGSSFWHRINQRTRTPTNSIWLAAVGAFILGVPYLWSPVAYFAITSIAVIGLYVAYVAPVFLRVRAGSRFQPGPWTLGRWGRPIGIVATIWVVVHLRPVHAAAVPAADRCNGLVWADLQLHARSSSSSSSAGRRSGTRVSAKNWFKGPKVQGTPEELAAIERELEVI